MDPEQEIAALAEHSGRTAGSDAERRAALHLRDRLRALGRAAELEPIEIRPRAALAHALHALLAIAGSLASVANAALGASLVLAAAVLTTLDVTGASQLTRAITGRRASQNVMSPEGGAKAGVIVLVAHYDAARGSAGLGGLTRWARDPWALALGSMVALLGCCALRVTGIDGTALSAVQFVPTVALVALTAILVDGELAGPSRADDNGAGVVTALRLAESVGGRLEHFDLWVLLTGAQKPFALGMRAWLRRHRKQLGGNRGVIVGLDDAGARGLRFARRHGPLVPLRAHRELVRLCRAVAEDGAQADEVVVREPVDAAAATARGIPAITVTGAGADPAGLERWFTFCRELIERIDAELGPRIERS